MPFEYRRVIRFHETDAAGVVYFSNVLTLCHEAYEASLEAAGFNLAEFFSQEGNIAVPISHTQSDFYRPMRCGDAIAIHLTPAQLAPHSFEISYKIHLKTQGSKKAPVAEKTAVHALTRHVCINPQTHRRRELTAELKHWIASLAHPAAQND